MMKTVMSNFPTGRSLLFLGCLSVASACYGQQVDEIIQSIEQEGSNSPKISTTPQPRPVNKIEHGKHDQKPKEATIKRDAIENAPSVKIWGPDDRLPEKIAGQYLIGDFIVSSQSPDGHAVLKAVSGGKGRCFEIDNMSAGLPQGQWQFFTTDQAPRLSFSASNPLVFINRGALGYYTVRAPQSSSPIQYGYGGYPTGNSQGGNYRPSYGSYYVPSPPAAP